MQTKLTLRLDERLILLAKAYAQRTGKSVSQIVADYFSLLEADIVSTDDQLPPIVSSLRGALSGGSVGEEEYRQHIEEKYL